MTAKFFMLLKFLERRFKIIKKFSSSMNLIIDVENFFVGMAQFMTRLSPRIHPKQF